MKKFGGVVGSAGDGAGVPVGSGAAFDDDPVVAHPVQGLDVFGKGGWASL